jgi:hypothetical protein
MDEKSDAKQGESEQERSVEEFDASGTARYAAARERLPEDMSAAGIADAAAGAAVGLTAHMGESPTSPGLAGDLRSPDEALPEDNG